MIPTLINARGEWTNAPMDDGHRTTGGKGAWVLGVRGDVPTYEERRMVVCTYSLIPPNSS